MIRVNDNRCVCCGAQIPEGSMVCVNCQKSAGVHKERSEEKFDRIMNDWIIPIGLVGVIIVLYFLIMR